MISITFGVNGLKEGTLSLKFTQIEFQYRSEEEKKLFNKIRANMNQMFSMQKAAVTEGQEAINSSKRS